MKSGHPKAATAASEMRVPADLRKALANDSSARAIWADITPVARRDWIRWIDSAKQPETRRRRIEQTSSKLIAGKRRPCCYAVVPFELYKALDAVPKAKAQWTSLTPGERRDIVDRIDLESEPKQRKHRIEQVCKTLAAGKRRF